MPKKRSIKREIIDVLREQKNGLHYRVITEFLLAKGVQINGQTPGLTVNSFLSRGKEFERISSGFYRLVDI